jgi:ATP-dependent helicase STH1/SNF2
MFTNAKTYNQEGSWVYNDAEEMWIVFEDAFNKHIAGSGLPGAPPAASISSNSNGANPAASSPASEVTRPGPSRKSSASRKQIISDDEYLTQPSDDE